MTEILLCNKLKRLPSCSHQVACINQCLCVRNGHTLDSGCEYGQVVKFDKNSHTKESVDNTQQIKDSISELENISSCIVSAGLPYSDSWKCRINAVIAKLTPVS